MARFVTQIKESKKLISVLEMEYEMTNKSDKLGNINKLNFVSLF